MQLRNFLAATILATLFAVSLAGCNPADQALLSRGIGTDLYTSDLPAQTAALENYVDLICRQARMSAGPDCGMTASISPDWTLFVQAGMNDVDRRCDAYLQWLDDRRRTNNAILHQIGDTQTGVEAGMAAAQVGAFPIAIAATAFGFARATYTNLASRLLMEVDHSTVEALVMTRRETFRNKLPPVIDNQPAAIYALRSYLRICLPFTIETEINNTITVFARGGRAPPPLVNPWNPKAQLIQHANISIPVVVRPPTPVILGPNPGGVRISITERQFNIMQGEACFPKTKPPTAAAVGELIDWMQSNGLKDMKQPNVINLKDFTTMNIERKC